jgi:hypothetical protein
MCPFKCNMSLIRCYKCCMLVSSHYDYKNLEAKCSYDTNASCSVRCITLFFWANMSFFGMCSKCPANPSSYNTLFSYRAITCPKKYVRQVEIVYGWHIFSILKWCDVGIKQLMHIILCWSCSVVLTFPVEFESFPLQCNKLTFKRFSCTCHPSSPTCTTIFAANHSIWYFFVWD